MRDGGKPLEGLRGRRWDLAGTEEVPGVDAPSSEQDSAWAAPLSTAFPELVVINKTWVKTIYIILLCVRNSEILPIIIVFFRPTLSPLLSHLCLPFLDLGNL